MRIGTWSRFGALALTLCSPACSSDGNDGSAPAAELDFTAFDQAVESFVAEKGLHGASAAIVQKGKGIVHLSGYGDYAEDRTYLVMSSSKSLSAGIALRLADQGKLDMDAPIGDVVSDWGDGKPALTAAQLVSGSSGLPSLVDNPLYLPYVCMFGDAGTLTDCARAIYTADDASVSVPADTEFHYGGAPWQLAGGVAEVASGKTWAELVEETYLDPCGITGLGFDNPLPLVLSAGATDPTSLGYPASFEGNVSKLPGSKNPSIEGGVYTTAEAYAKVLSLFLEGGTCNGTRVLSEKAVARLQEDRIASYGGNTSDQMKKILTGADPAVVDAALDFAGYGMGFWVNRKEPGFVLDPGAFGAQAWIDEARGYAGFIAIEGTAPLGAEVLMDAKPPIDAQIDAAK